MISEDQMESRNLWSALLEIHLKINSKGNKVKYLETDGLIIWKIEEFVKTTQVNKQSSKSRLTDRC